MKKGVGAAKVKEQETEAYLKLMGEKLEELLGDNQEQRKQWTMRCERKAEKSRSEKTNEDMCIHNSQVPGKWSVSAITIDTGPEVSAAKKKVQPLGNGLHFPGRVAGYTVRLLVDTGSSVSLLNTRVWNAWAQPKGEL